ncbi:MAG: putative zinc-binding protein [Candidatus Thorarchaeota archaeon]
MTFKPKIGLISCSGEACKGGKISRAATLEVLHHLKPDDTVTICLPLFLAGGEGEREFAKNFPTVTIDGCSKLCAAKGTARYSSEPAVRINLGDYVENSSSAADEGGIIDGNSDLIDRIADDIAEHVDRLRNEWK